jgi:hypothetical protein
MIISHMSLQYNRLQDFIDLRSFRRGKLTVAFLDIVEITVQPGRASLLLKGDPE